MANSLNTALGTTGQILKHNGTGNAPSFTSTYGTLKYLNTYTCSADTSKTITSVMDSSLYYAYRLILKDMTSSSGSPGLRLTCSSNNGSTWGTTYNQSTETCTEASTPVVSQSQGVSVGVMTILTLSSTTSGNSAKIECFATPGLFIIENTNTATNQLRLSAGYSTTTSVNALKFDVSTSSMNGTIEIYGYLK